MIGSISCVILHQLIEREMAKKPAVKPQGRAVYVGSYEEVLEGGRVRLEEKQKRAKLPPHVAYANANKRKVKRGKRV